MSATWEIRGGDVLDHLRGIDAGSIQCCITSPPYFGLRDYGLPASMWGDGWIGCLGLESSVDQFVVHLVEVFAEVRRVLRPDGTLWLNLGDSYARSAGPRNGNFGRSAKGIGIPDGNRDSRGRHGVKGKDLLGIPWMAAFALRADGWFLRSEIIWSKPNPMPEAVQDRPTKAHEQVFLLSKQAAYYYDAAAIAELSKDWSTGGPGTGILSTEHYGAGNGGNSGLGALAARYKRGEAQQKRNKRSVWTVATRPYPAAHFATFPARLIEPMVLAGCPGGGLVLDPFAGSGTTLQVAVERGRNALGIELNPAYVALAEKRLSGVTAPLFTSSEAA
jgi:DNA modification methylase